MKIRVDDFVALMVMGGTLEPQVGTRDPVSGVRRGLTRLAPFRLLFRGSISVTLEKKWQF
jgi:hypothetical protein